MKGQKSIDPFCTKGKGTRKGERRRRRVNEVRRMGRKV